MNSSTFKNEEKSEIYERLSRSKNKSKEIKLITKRISDIISYNFFDNISKVFIKTSTGYYGGFGATIIDLKTIKSFCGDMPIKASGGVSDLTMCMKMIALGVSRIGTSKALAIHQEFHS